MNNSAHKLPLRRGNRESSTTKVNENVIKIARKEIYQILRRYHLLDYTNIFKVENIYLKVQKRDNFMENKDFVAFMMNKFNFNLSTLSSRIAFQKTIFITQEFGSGTSFNFRWHNYGPYSQELADVAFRLNLDQIEKSAPIETNAITNFIKVIDSDISNSKFLEMLADIIYLKKYSLVMDTEELFKRIIEHRTYLNDRIMFNLAIDRLSKVNFV